jgi:colanic acid/amylovoran biosynthesis glycosyltransferase
MKIAYFFLHYPRLSQQFLQREIAGLGAQGIEVEVWSFLDLCPVGAVAMPRGAALRHFGWWNAWEICIALPREWVRDPALLADGLKYWAAYRPATIENLFHTLWGALFAVCRAEEIRQSDVVHLHGAWATGPATAAAVLGRLTGKPFSFGAHAYDIYKQGGDAFLEPKMAAAAFVHTTTQSNVRFLREKHPGAQLVLARRGLPDLPEILIRPSHGQGVRLLSVGRLVPKKGHRHQLEACRCLRQRDVRFYLKIIGDGPLEGQLKRMIKSMDLENSVEFCGALPPEQVAEAYRWADVFWHTGLVDAEGDRDGLPNVVPEAMARELPVICGLEPGVGEAVRDGVQGLVVDVRQADKLAEAAAALAADPALRGRMGRAGRAWVEENFLAEKNTAILAQAFRQSPGFKRAD